MLPDVEDLSFRVIRCIRVLKPLRTFSRNQNIRFQVNCLIQSLPKLMHVFVFIMFFLVGASIVGTYMFMGRWDKRCRLYK